MRILLYHSFVKYLTSEMDIYTHLFSALLIKGGEAIVVSADIDELPMVFPAYSFQIVDVLCLEGLIVLASVTPGREFISEILFEFCDFSHCLKTSLIKFDDAYMLAL